MEQQRETVAGTVTQVIFKNDDNGYTVAQIRTADDAELTIVGCMPFLGCGERISATGAYQNHPQHGTQFAVETYLREMPADTAGILEYLSSRTVKGIGPKTARAIVNRFGRETFDVLAEMPERLAEIRGITESRAREIQQSFLRLGAMRRLLEFLLQYELPARFAAPLVQLYGEEAAAQVRRDPYLLCGERFGLDFAQADRMALDLGLGEENPMRLDAALLYVLRFNLQAGHAFVPEDKLLALAAQIAGTDEDALYPRLEALIEKGRLVPQTIANVDAVYLEEVFRQERFAAEEIARLWRMKLAAPPNLDKSLRRQEQNSGLNYSEGQREAIALPFSSGLTLVTGGPGTGKTTALLTMISLFEEYGLNAQLAAPTGRAAKRMSELCGREAKTIHRLLEAGYDQNGDLSFRRDHSQPLDADVIVIDESSMLELSLAASLLDALRPHTRLVLVGDADQLPPVGAGSFFADLLACRMLPRVRLTEVFRQALDSDIIVAAHAIDQGQVPRLAGNDKDFYFTNGRSTDAVIATVVSLLTQRIPGHFGIAPDNIQVICPSRRTPCGTESLNRVLQEALNPPGLGKGEIPFGGITFRVGDRVMQTRNNYDLLWKRAGTLEPGTGVYNGDVGVVTLIDRAAGLMTVRFDDRDADYELEQLSELEHAFAMTVHKSQGSEYDAVILPLWNVPERLRSRNLLYTAVTRAKKLLVIVGREELVGEMIAANTAHKRYGALRQRIRSLCDEDA